MVTQFDRYKVIEKYLTKEERKEIGIITDDFFNSEFDVSMSELDTKKVACCLYAAELLKLKFGRLRGRALSSIRKREKKEG